MASKKVYKVCLSGNSQNEEKDVATLHLVWHYGIDTTQPIYCHHAVLEIPCVSDSLFPADLAKVTLVYRTNTFENGKIKGFYDSSLDCVLPIEYATGKMIIELNSIVLLEKLCEEQWTKGKEGKKKSLKGFPISLKIESEDKQILVVNFDEIGIKRPYEISEQFFSNMVLNDMVDVHIYLDI